MTDALERVRGFHANRREPCEDDRFSGEQGGKKRKGPESGEGTRRDKTNMAWDHYERSELVHAGATKKKTCDVAQKKEGK